MGADFNRHVAEGNRGDQEVMGRFWVKERNFERQMVVDFAKRIERTELNTSFQKREKHNVTYKCRGRSRQLDYILCRLCNLKSDHPILSSCRYVLPFFIQHLLEFSYISAY